MARLPRFDLMRNHIEGLREKYSKDGNFMRAVYDCPYYKSEYYRQSVLNYARSLID